MRPVRILCLGDSYTVGECVDPAESWPRQLSGVLARRGVMAVPDIVAKSGWTTDELLAAIEERTLEGPWELVTLLAGVNDHYRGRTIAEFRASYALLLGRAVSLAGEGRRTLALSIPDWGVTPFASARDREAIAAGIDAFNGAAAELARRAGARWVDVTAVSRKAADDPGLIANDGLHLSGRAYREWAERLIPLVESVLH